MAKKPAPRGTRAAKKSKDPLEWWREARFGMFIHWGVYAVPAGTWKGKRIRGIGEWIMHHARIPIADYEQLAKKFNPVKFNADAWVKVAKDAGMKYIVITSKHHDGFAMFGSKVSKYNIVDATPYRRDPLKALALACRKAGIRLCFYHSQDFDWHHPGGAGNDWDYEPIAGNPTGFRRRFARYLRDKVRPQLRELLTNYGPIGLIWFDCPAHVTRAQSLDLKKFVHKLQPKCLVSGRVGNDLGDYGSMGDNQIPAGRVQGDWETPATLNDTWGFKSYDHNWKSVDQLLYLLVDLASKGVNYLLNVGPTAEGIIPKPSVDRLKEIGKWMKVNGEAIYGTSPNPYPYELPWGRITQKPGKLYLLLYKWRRKLVLHGLRNKVKTAYLLRGRKKLQFTQTHDKAADHHVLELTLPAKKPDKYISVVVLEIAGKTNVDESPLQQPTGEVILPAYMADVHTAKTGTKMRISRGGDTENWHNNSNWLIWRFKVSRPGRFVVKVLTYGPSHGRWKGGHRVKLSFGQKSLVKTLKGDQISWTPRIRYWPEAASIMGEVRIDKPGTHELKLRAVKIRKPGPGLVVNRVKLQPV